MIGFGDIISLNFYIMFSDTFDPVEYMADMKRKEDELDAMSVEELVSHIIGKCSKAPFYASLMMGPHFVSVKDQIVKIKTIYP